MIYFSARILAWLMIVMGMTVAVGSFVWLVCYFWKHMPAMSTTLAAVVTVFLILLAIMMTRRS